MNLQVPLNQIFDAIDLVNGEDPGTTFFGGASHPAERLYGQRMSHHLSSVSTHAGEALQIAARGAHLRRWLMPRSTYPEGRVGYLTWRKELGRFHAREVAALLAPWELGEMFTNRVGALIRKESLATDPEAQALEDSACLTFLELEYNPFLEKHEDAKVIDILQKTWKKMSPAGHKAALDLAAALRGRGRDLLDRALS
jgi:hypothetical protein